MMNSLRAIVEQHDTVPGRIFDYVVQGLIVISLVTFSIETLPGLSENTRRILRACEITTVTIFSLEYLLRILVSQPKRKYVFSFFGIVDLLAILPFYVSVGIDLRAIRVVRLLRLFRTLKFVRYSRAVRRYHRAFLIVREEMLLFFSVTLIVFYLAGVGIYYFENPVQPEVFSSVFHGLWWAVITLTTVGYGDAIPITVGGKLFTFVILMIGLGLVAVPSGLMASALTEARVMEEKQLGSEDRQQGNLGD